MKSLFIIFFIIFNILYSSSLLEERAFSDDTSTEIIFFFNLPFYGDIQRQINSNQIFISLLDARIEKKIAKEINSNTVKNYTIYQNKNNIDIIILLKNAKNLKIMRDDNNFKIKIKISSLTEELNKENKINNTKEVISNKNNLNLFLLILSFMLFFVIAYLLYEKFTKNKPLNLNEDFTILNQKELDSKNKLTLIKFKNKEYLVITGNSNVVLNENTSERGKHFTDELINDKLEKYKDKL